MDIKEKARNLPQETVDRIQDFFDGKRKLEADELGYDKDNLLLLNELVNSGRITLPEIPNSQPGFHEFWSSWNKPLHEQHSSIMNLGE